MKKILAVLLVLAMALSMSSVAFAADEIDCYEMESYQGGRREGVAIKDMKQGDIVGFYVKAVPGTGIDGVGQLKMYVRHVDGGSTKGKRLDAEGNITDKLCYDIWFDSEDAYLWKNDDGWFYIEAEIQKDGDNFLAVVTYDEGESSTYPDAQVAECLVAGITVNGVAVDPARVYGFDGSAATTLAAKTTMADPRSAATETPAETEDAPVEETGVVSIAVVAVAAVIGGAVVLKKREF
ncbi:MAG: acid shock protein [Clostridia bacterium]|nr:acid shock protein [Clostridia bacterium]